MKQLVIRWIINSTALLVVAHLVSGVALDNWVTVFVAALVLGLLNAFLRPVLIFLTLPVTILSLGLFTLVINAFLFYLASHLVRGFHVAGFGQAFVAAWSSASSASCLTCSSARTADRQSSKRRILRLQLS